MSSSKHSLLLVVKNVKNHLKGIGKPENFGFIPGIKVPLTVLHWIMQIYLKELFQFMIWVLDSTVTLKLTRKVVLAILFAIMNTTQISSILIGKLDT